MALGRLFAGMLFEIGSTDPVTLALVGITVVGVTVVAALAPAWRAASADPLTVLRAVLPSCRPSNRPARRVADRLTVVRTE